MSYAVLEEAVSRGVIAQGDESKRPVGAKIASWVGDRAAAAGAPTTAGAAGAYLRLWERGHGPGGAPLLDAVGVGRVSVTVAACLGADL